MGCKQLIYHHFMLGRAVLLGMILLGCAGVVPAEEEGPYLYIQPPKSIANFYEAQLILCKDERADCWDMPALPAQRLLMRASLIPEKSKRGTEQAHIKRPDRHWIIELAEGVTFAEVLKRLDDLGCGPGEQHFIHAIERQFVGHHPAHAPFEFRRLK